MHTHTLFFSCACSMILKAWTLHWLKIDSFGFYTHIHTHISCSDIYLCVQYDLGSKDLGLTENGYFQFFHRFSQEEALKQLAELKSDRCVHVCMYAVCECTHTHACTTWINKSAKWLRLDFSVYV